MRVQKKRRERLFRSGKPVVRPMVYEDIRWLWAAAKRAGENWDQVEFTDYIEPTLAQADKIFILEDVNQDYSKGSGPVGVVLSNYDDWSMVPHVEWFPWATPRNKLRCTIAFLEITRYARSVGSIKILSTDDNAKWFKKLRKYLPIILVGKIPGGRSEGTEWIFYVRGRRNEHQNAVRRKQDTVREPGIRHTAVAGSNP